MTQLKNEAFHKPPHVWNRVSVCWIQNYCETHVWALDLILLVITFTLILLLFLL